MEADTGTVGLLLSSNTGTGLVLRPFDFRKLLRSVRVLRMYVWRRFALLYFSVIISGSEPGEGIESRFHT